MTLYERMMVDCDGHHLAANNRRTNKGPRDGEKQQLPPRQQHWRALEPLAISRSQRPSAA